jgi:hypothetical protein
MYIWVFMRTFHRKQNQPRTKQHPHTTKHQPSCHLLPGRIHNPNPAQAATLDQCDTCSGGRYNSALISTQRLWLRSIGIKHPFLVIYTPAPLHTLHLYTHSAAPRVSALATRHTLAHHTVLLQDSVDSNYTPAVVVDTAVDIEPVVALFAAFAAMLGPASERVLADEPSASAAAAPCPAQTRATQAPFCCNQAMCTRADSRMPCPRS